MEKVKVAKLDKLTGKVLEKYESVREAARKNYIDVKSVSRVINGDQKTAAGYRWCKI